MEETKKVFWALAIVVPLLLFVVAMWNIDIAVSALLIEDGVAVWGDNNVRDPIAHYHLSIAILGLSGVVGFSANVFLLLSYQEQRCLNQYRHQ